jgi:hypothetical protein
MKAYGKWIYIYIHIFLTSTLAGGKWSASSPGRFTLGERFPSTHWIGDWVDPRAGVDDVEKRKFMTLPRLELRSLGRPASSQSLYQLRYPGSLSTTIYVHIIIHKVPYILLLENLNLELRSETQFEYERSRVSAHKTRNLRVS